jgi:hypothetical protein
MHRYKRFFSNYSNITKDLVELLLSEEFKVEDYYAEDAVNMDCSIAETFGSEYPTFMQIQRPNESAKQQNYRREYFEQTGNPIMGYLGQIEKQVDKVLNSTETKIKFSPLSRIKKSDSIEYYMNNEYYNGESLFSSFREMIKSKTLISPNSVLVVIPNEVKDDYPKPYFLIAKPENVIYFKANELTIIKSEILGDVYYENTKETIKEGETFYLFDREKYLVASHTGYTDDLRKIWSVNSIGSQDKPLYLNHGCNYMPCKKIGRKVLEQTEDGHELRTSDLYDSMVFLRNAIMNYMDLVVEHNFHVASQEWAVGTIDCNSCRGSGKVKGEGKPAQCTTCGGGGKVQTMSGSGLDKIIIPHSINELGRTEKVSNIVGGFIARPETGARLFKEAFINNMQLALQPFGLEHLMKVPLNQSGTAKDYDMQEGYVFIQAISQHIEGLFKMVIESITRMRFKKLDKETVEMELPTLVMPKSFNLSSSETILKKLQDATTYNLPDYVRLKYAEDLIEKETGLNSYEMQYFKARLNVDPLPAMNFNNKLIAKAFLSDLEYIVTMRIESLLHEARTSDIGFLLKSASEQKSAVYNLAKKYLIDVGDNLNEDVTVKPNVNLVGESQQS